MLEDQKPDLDKYPAIKSFLEIKRVAPTGKDKHEAEVRRRDLSRKALRGFVFATQAQRTMQSLNEFKRQAIFTILDLNPPKLVEKLFPSGIVLEYKDNKDIATWEKQKQQHNLSL